MALISVDKIMLCSLTQAPVYRSLVETIIHLWFSEKDNTVTRKCCFIWLTDGGFLSMDEGKFVVCVEEQEQVHESINRNEKRDRPLLSHTD